MIGIITQATTQPVISGGVNLSEYLGSIGAILAVSTFIISASKAYIAKIPYLNKIPVFVLSLILSVLLTVVAVHIHTMSGQLGPLIVAVLIQAVGSAGFQVDNPTMVFHQNFQSSVASDAQLVSAKNLKAAGPPTT